MTIDEILSILKYPIDFYGLTVTQAKSSIRKLVMEEISKENMPVPVEPLPSADISFAKGWNDCLANVRARLDKLFK